MRIIRRRPHGRLSRFVTTLAVAALSAAGLIAVASPAHAALTCPPEGYVLKGGSLQPPIHLSPSTVYYYIDETGAPFAGATSLIQRALDTWSTTPGSTLRFVFAGRTTGGRTAADGRSVIYWKYNGTREYTGITDTFPKGTAFRTEFDMELNTAYPWTPIAGVTEIDNLPAMDPQTIALHESGHALGLDHVTDNCNNSVMRKSFNGGMRIRTPSWGDVAGLRYLYPVPPPVNRTGVPSYNRMQPGAPHNGYFLTAWQPFVAASNQITLLGATVGNPTMPGGATVSTTLRMRLCTTTNCSVVLAERNPQIVNYGNTAVDIGDVPVTRGATYYIVWYQPAAANGRTWVTYWWAGGSTVSTSDQMQAIVLGFNA